MAARGLDAQILRTTEAAAQDPLYRLEGHFLWSDLVLAPLAQNVVYQRLRADRRSQADGVCRLAVAHQLVRHGRDTARAQAGLAIIAALPDLLQLTGQHRRLDLRH